jgi:hypothetical protein
VYTRDRREAKKLIPANYRDTHRVCEVCQMRSRAGLRPPLLVCSVPLATQQPENGENERHYDPPKAPGRPAPDTTGRRVRLSGKREAQNGDAG